MNYFQQRLGPAQQFEQDIMALLRKHPEVIDICANGTEHTHPIFVNRLRWNTSPAAKFIRFAPDGVVLTTMQEVIHVDAKCAKNIEKDAYDIYRRYIKGGCRLILLVKNRDTDIIYWQDIQRIKLIDGEKTVAQYPTHLQYPVVDGWISPREKKGFFANGHMSGTPYKMINFKSMREFNQQQMELFAQERRLFKHH